MNKINFTKEHSNQMADLAVQALFNDTKFKGELGNEYTVRELIHQLSVNSLVKLKANLSKKIEELDVEDPWEVSQEKARELAELETKRALVNLLIGWRKFTSQEAQIEARVAALKQELDKITIESMSPEEKKAALQREIDNLTSGNEPLTTQSAETEA